MIFRLVPLDILFFNPNTVESCMVDRFALATPTNEFLISTVLLSLPKMLDEVTFSTIEFRPTTDDVSTERICEPYPPNTDDDTLSTVRLFHTIFVSVVFDTVLELP